ncbi:MAG: peptidylprolyl isomerase [Candidatus Hinthialibacter antarcticus]|nr:peptidylprolyl isomerase [Candidatus Hinthialibacter antarcticus]
MRPDSNFRLLIVAVLTACFAAACSQQAAQRPIAVVEGQKIYYPELESLGVIALSKKGLSTNTPEGQAYYKEILPTLYESIIDIYALKHAALSEGYEPTPDELDAQYQAIKETINQAEGYETALKALQLSDEEFKESIQVQMAVQQLQESKLNTFTYEPDDTEIEAYYYKNNLQFRHPYSVRVSHIFISTPVSAGDDARAEAKERAEQLGKMVGNNPAKTFPQLAVRYSQDNQTKARGGDLGFIKRNDDILLETFKKAAFALGAGEVSQPIETDFGYHLIWSTDHEQSLEEAKPIIKRQMLLNKAGEFFEAWKKEMRAGLDIERLFDPVAIDSIDKTPAAQ